MEGWKQDVVWALRSLRGTPRLTLAAVACVTVGIGASSFIVALADGALLQRLPFQDADRLVRIYTVHEATGLRGDLSWPDIRDLRDRVTTVDRWEVAARTRLALTTELGTERLRGESVTPGYFELAGIEPALGRAFTAEEHRPGGADVLLLSDALWRRRFGADPAIVGRTVLARGSTGRDGDRSYEVVGVLPPDFAGTVDEDVSDFWLPLEDYAPRPVLEMRTARMAWVLARLRPGVDAVEATREVEEVGRALAAEVPEAYPGIRLATEPVGEYWRARLRPGLVVLTAAAGLLLLIACINLAALLLARIVRREGELAVRTALGAGRPRVLRQVLVESLLIGGTGSALGAGLAWWGSGAFARAGLLAVPSYVTLEPDPTVLAFALAATLATCLAAGALPALLALRVHPAGALRAAGRSPAPRTRWLIDGLVAAEVAFTFALLVGAGLLLRSHAALTSTDPGYRVRDVGRLAVSLDGAEYPDAASRVAFVAEARAALASRPGVREVAFQAGVLPPWFDLQVALAVDGRPHPALARVERHAVDHAMDDVLALRLLHGRFVEEADGPDASRVAVASASVAAVVGGGDPARALGRTVAPVLEEATGRLGAPMEIVGVVDDVRYQGPLGTTRPRQLDLWVPLSQEPSPIVSVAVHTDGDAGGLLEPLQRELARLAPTSPLHWISTMEDELALQFARARFLARATSVFGLSALVLALLGVYGVLSHVVARRMDEMGIRMALGAEAGAVVRLVTFRGVRAVAAGLLLGTALAAAAGGALDRVVYGIGVTDPATFGAAASGLLLLAAIACWLPARRATRVDLTAVMRGRAGR